MRWTIDELELLKKLYAEGVMYRDMSKQLPRHTAIGIASHAKLIGLPRRVNWMTTDYQWIRKRGCWERWAEDPPNLSSVELAYIAGILDGEGTISLSRGKAKKGYCGARFTPRITVSNTSLKLIDWLKERLEMTNPSIVVRHTWKPNKPVYNISVTSFRAIALAKALIQYLVIKREQAQILLDYYEVRKEKNYMGAYTQEEFDLYVRVVKLNNRSRKFTMKPFAGVAIVE
jgi:hypothetical protein